MTRLLCTTVFYSAFTIAAACAVVHAIGNVADASERRDTAAYMPPVGIPAPTFGIHESHHMYAGKTFEAGGFK